MEKHPWSTFSSDRERTFLLIEAMGLQGGQITTQPGLIN